MKFVTQNPISTHCTKEDTMKAPQKCSTPSIQLVKGECAPFNIFWW